MKPTPEMHEPIEQTKSVWLDRERTHFMIDDPQYVYNGCELVGQITLKLSDGKFSVAPQADDWIAKYSKISGISTAHIRTVPLDEPAQADDELVFPTLERRVIGKITQADDGKDALIRDLVAALAGVMNCWGNAESAKADRAARAALTRAKEAGYCV